MSKSKKNSKKNVAAKVENTTAVEATSAPAVESVPVAEASAPAVESAAPVVAVAEAQVTESAQVETVAPAAPEIKAESTPVVETVAPIAPVASIIPDGQTGETVLEHAPEAPAKVEPIVKVKAVKKAHSELINMETEFTVQTFAEKHNIEAVQANNVLMFLVSKGKASILRPLVQEGIRGRPANVFSNPGKIEIEL